MSNSDAQLIERYLRDGSEAAFTELVARHAGLVCAAANRQIHDRHLAEDVTQAVFIILAQKAGTLRKQTSITGWLLTVTRHTALALRHKEINMKSRELQAGPREDADGSNLLMVEHLDEALAKLGDRDRQVVAMHYLQGKRLNEVGEMLGITEDAASKRSRRALEKLRTIFVRMGVTMESSALAAGLELQYHRGRDFVQLPNLAKNTLEHATENSASLAHAMIRTMTLVKAKLLVTCCATSLVILGTLIGLWMLNKSSPAVAQVAPVAAIAQTQPTATTPPQKVSINIPLRQLNVIQGRPGDYEHGYEPAEPGSSREVGYVSAAVGTPQNFAGYYGTIDPTPLRGQRVRLSAMIESTNADRWVGMFMSLKDAQSRLLAYDNMSDRPLTQTTAWKRCEVVIDVPIDCSSILFGFLINGRGQMRFDDIAVTTVGQDVPTTDGTHWHTASKRPAAYQVGEDPATQLNGHATIRIKSDAADPDDWTKWIRDQYRIEEYRGHKVRVSAMIKSSDVKRPSGICVHVFGNGFKMLANAPANQPGKKYSDPNVPRVVGTSDWKKYEVILNVPNDAELICLGAVLNGTGTLWVDDVHWEVVP